MVQRHLPELSRAFRQRLRRYSIYHRQVAILWMYLLLLPSGMCLSIYALLHVINTRQLAYEAYKSKKIIASRDISYAFTNVMANNYYSLSPQMLIYSFPTV